MNSVASRLKEKIGKEHRCFRFWYEDDKVEMMIDDASELSFEEMKSFFKGDMTLVPMQKTGLKDCRDKSLFEGDIVKYCPTDEFALVVFRDAWFWLYFASGTIVPLSRYNSSLCGVKGNVYENSELGELFNSVDFSK